MSSQPELRKLFAMSTSTSLCSQAVPAIRLMEQFREVAIASGFVVRERDYGQLETLIHETYQMSNEQISDFLIKLSFWLVINGVDLARDMGVLGCAGFTMQYVKDHHIPLQECAVWVNH